MTSLAGTEQTEATMSGHGERPDISLVIPLLNEEKCVGPLYREIVDVMTRSGRTWEMIFVDDGSTDNTVPLLQEVVNGAPQVRIIEFTRRFGQTAALAAGFAYARGRVIVPLDGDGQNDPKDIPQLVAKLDESPGWDIVSGWRRDRKDHIFSRRMPSALANWLVRRLTWTPELHDFGCTLKAYRREVLEDVRLYGEMHRFLPAICKWRGARVTEMVVNHRPRTAGRSKYGLKRSAKVLLDLMTVKFFGDYLAKPIYFFGKLMFASLAIAFITLALAIAQKFGYLTFDNEPLNLNNNVLVLFAMMVFLISIMFLMMGLISELLVRIYHASEGIRPYKIRRIARYAEVEPNSSEFTAPPVTPDDGSTSSSRVPEAEVLYTSRNPSQVRK